MAGLFGQMKDIYKMQKEAKEMQKKMKAIVVEGKSEDELVVVKIDGTQEVQEVHIDDQLLNVDRKRDLEKGFKQALKDAQKRIQKELMKDMDISQIKNMLS